MKVINVIMFWISGVSHWYSTRSLRKIVVNNHHDALKLADFADVDDFRKQGFSISDSYVYDLKHQDYRRYITTWESYQPRCRSKMKKYFPISDDKYLFFLVFSHFIKTPNCYALINNGKVIWLSDKYHGCDVYDFLLQNKGGVIKDRGGSDGFEVYVFSTDDYCKQLFYREKPVSKEDLQQILLKSKNCILQERVEQGDFANAIYNKSINTLRVITVNNGKGKNEVVGAVLRIGTRQSFPVDNFSQGGGSCLVDVETGEMGPMTTLFSKNKESRFVFFNNHPDSGTLLKGKKIPHWIEIKKTLLELMEKLPFFEYIAWDIALQNDGISVLETNMKSSLNVFQIHGPIRDSLIGAKYREHGWLVDE